MLQCHAKNCAKRRNGIITAQNVPETVALCRIQFDHLLNWVGRSHRQGIQARGS